MIGSDRHPGQAWVIGRRRLAMTTLALLGSAASARAQAERPDPAAEAAARAAAAALQADLDRRIGLLVELAAAPGFERPVAALRDLDRLARAAADRLGAPVAIADDSLAGLVDTAQEFGTPLPGLGDAPAALEVLESGQPGIAEAIAEPDLPLHLAVPARREGRVRAVLLTAVPRSALDALLAAVPEAAGTTLAVFPPGGPAVAGAVADGANPALVRQALQSGTPQIALADGTAWSLASQALGLAPGWHLVAARRVPAAMPTPDPALPASPAFPPQSPAMRATAQAVAPPIAPGPAPVAAPGPSLALLAGGGILGATLLGAALGLRRRRRGAMEGGEAAALHSLAEMRRLNDTIPVALALLDREQRFVSVNARFASITGLPAREHIRRLPRDVLPPVIAEALVESVRAVLGTGQPAIEVPISAEAPGEIRNERHYLASCHPAQDSAGRVTGVSVVLQDVTDRVRAERARELLVRELNHRVKNTLATVQSIVASTLRQTGDTARFGAALNARLQALARAHDLLTARDWQATELGDAVQAALSPWLQDKPARIIVDGPPGVTLRPGQAQALVLALHELATNAVKHGALSAPDGRVAVAWEAEPGEPVRLRWIESGGPPVAEPPREQRGFGTRLLERALASDLGSGATVRLQFAPQGLRALVTFGAPEAVVRGAAARPPAARIPLSPAA